jgi:DNA polymerase III epsilon subunit-like protein
MPIPRESADVHKITDEMVKGKPLFRKVKWEIWARMRDRLFVAYNADFDWRFLEAEMARAGLTMPSVPVLDPIVWARQLLAGEKSHRLERVCEKLGIPLESAHRAEHDAEAAGKVALRLADKLPVSLGDLLREQAAWKRKQDEAYAARRAEREQRAVGRGGGEGSGREPEEAADRKQTGLF